MIKFTFSEKQELKDILWLYSESSFFSNMPYKVYYPNIPGDLVKSLETNPKDKKNIQELKKQFIPIFNEESDLYEASLNKVKKGWQKIQYPFFSYLRDIIDYKDSIVCFISRYGPGGTFYLPNTISVRVRSENHEDIQDANIKIAHEIVHICVDKLVKKYKLYFEDTERLVDLVLTKTEIGKLLDNPTMQKFGNPKLDEIFIKNNFNIESTLAEYKKPPISAK